MVDDAVLAKIDQASKLLFQAKTIQDAKRISDLAAAARVYAQRVKAGKEVVDYATEVQIRALWLLGEFLANEKNFLPVGKENRGRPKFVPEGITWRISARSQLLRRALSPERLSQKLEEAKAKEALSVTGFIKSVSKDFKSQLREERTKCKESVGNSNEVEIFCSDIKLAPVADESIDVTAMAPISSRPLSA